jgi:hypothetical protein
MKPQESILCIEHKTAKRTNLKITAVGSIYESKMCGPRPCLLPEIFLQNIQYSPSHQILRHMHETLK